jgi:hypothetical protein
MKIHITFVMCGLVPAMDPHSGPVLAAPAVLTAAAVLAAVAVRALAVLAAPAVLVVAAVLAAPAVLTALAVLVVVAVLAVPGWEPAARAAGPVGAMPSPTASTTADTDRRPIRIRTSGERISGHKERNGCQCPPGDVHQARVLLQPAAERHSV